MTSTGAAAGFFQGVVDEARIWNVARSRAQIQAAKNTEIGRPGRPDRPLALQRGQRHDRRRRAPAAASTARSAGAAPPGSMGSCRRTGASPERAGPDGAGQRLDRDRARRRPSTSWSRTRTTRPLTCRSSGAAGQRRFALDRHRRPVSLGRSRARPWPVSAAARRTSGSRPSTTARPRRPARPGRSTRPPGPTRCSSVPATSRLCDVHRRRGDRRGHGRYRRADLHHRRQRLPERHAGGVQDLLRRRSGARSRRGPAGPRQPRLEHRNLDGYNAYFGANATDANGQSYYSYDVEQPLARRQPRLRVRPGARRLRRGSRPGGVAEGRPAPTRPRT